MIWRAPDQRSLGQLFRLLLDYMLAPSDIIGLTLRAGRVERVHSFIDHWKSVALVHLYFLYVGTWGPSIQSINPFFINS